MPAFFRHLAILSLVFSVACLEGDKDDDDDDDDDPADDTGMEDGGAVSDGGSGDGGTESDGGSGDGGSGDGGSSDGGSADGGGDDGGSSDGGGGDGGWPGDGGSSDGGAYPDGLGIYYGWWSEFTIDASSQTGEGNEYFFYFNEDEYYDFTCITARDGDAVPSSYDCPDCEFALSIDLSPSYEYQSIELDSGVDGCDMLDLGLDDESINTAFTRDGIGFASSYAGYADVMVYYFPSYGQWYPIAYSEWDGEDWYYFYGPSSWYYYFYY